MAFLLDNNLADGLILPKGIVAYANYASFVPGRVIEFNKVQSRMFVWCLNGSGTIEVNSKSFEITPKSFLFLPWNHQIKYKAALREPYLLAGIHIVPFLKSTQGFDYNVFHTERQDLAEYHQRSDTIIEGLEGVLEGKFVVNSRLNQLATYTVQWFLSGKKELFMSNFLASALIYELLNEKSYAQMQSKAAASPLGDVLKYIDHDLSEPLDIDRLAKVGDCCRSAVDQKQLTDWTNCRKGRH